MDILGGRVEEWGGDGWGLMLGHTWVLLYILIIVCTSMYLCTTDTANGGTSPFRRCLFYSGTYTEYVLYICR